jgi:hypothetical protein
MTAEELQAIRARVDERCDAIATTQDPGLRGFFAITDIRALLAHVDALRRERDEARDAFRSETKRLHAEIREARVEVTDAMVERACEAVCPVSVGHPWAAYSTIAPQYAQTLRDNVRIALSAALGGDREGGRG